MRIESIIERRSSDHRMEISSEETMMSSLSSFSSPVLIRTTVSGKVSNDDTMTRNCPGRRNEQGDDDDDDDETALPRNVLNGVSVPVPKTNSQYEHPSPNSIVSTVPTESVLRRETSSSSQPFGTVRNNSNTIDPLDTLLRIEDHPYNNKSFTKVPSSSSLYRNVMSESTESASKYSNDPVATIIRNTMMKFQNSSINNNNSDNEDGTSTKKQALKLSQLLSATENDRISMEDALVAAVNDIMTLQNHSTKMEHQLQESDDRYSTLLSNHTSLETELASVQQQLKDLQQSHDEVVAKNQKMGTNLKKKKELLAQCNAQLKTASATIETLEHEKGMLMQGIQKLTMGRDELKTKLVCKNEVSREQRSQVERLERRLKVIQTGRTKELQLLELYRQLSIHTGYFKWGKQIRMVESDLAEYNNNLQQEESTSSESY